MQDKAPSSGPIRAMFLGTCRMHDPEHTIQKSSGLHTRRTPHRVHSPGQVLAFIRHMNGTAPYRPETVHLVSDHAAEQVLALGQDRQDLLDKLEDLRSVWPSFAVHVIEISALREFEADLGGTSLMVNIFAERDQERYADEIARQAAAGVSVPVAPISMRRLTQHQVLIGMRQIKAELKGKPVIWVSHIRPGGTEERDAVVNAVRLLGANTLRAGAAALGDRFFDPSEVAAEMGRAAFFQKNGEDLDHMTPAAAERLGQIYLGMIRDILGS